MGMNYHIFDAVSLEEWKSQNSMLEFTNRNQAVNDLVKVIASDKIKAVPSTLINNESELRNFYLKYLGEGYEGVMLKDPNAKYVWKRSKAILKLKPVSTHEGVVVAWVEGKRGTKREGMFGGFTVLFPNGVTTNVASGFNDKLKAEVQLNGADSYIGKVVECEAQPPFTEDGRLRFPVFVRFRDKSDVAPEVLEAYEKYQK
jgi:DNA ligase-1